jgi:predicted PurR-regulated permease PerM/predicted N-acetyltransferase YhbS
VRGALLPVLAGVLAGVLALQVGLRLVPLLSGLGAATLIALAVEPVVSRAAYQGVPRPLAALFVLVVVLAAAVGTTATVLHGLQGDVDPFARTAELLSTLEHRLSDSSLQHRLGTDVDLAGLLHGSVAGFTSADRVLLSVTGGMGSLTSAAVTTGEVVLLAGLVSAELPRTQRLATSWLSAPRRLAVEAALAEAAGTVSRYAGAQVVLALLNGFVTLVVAVATGSPGPFVLAAAGFVLAFVPLVGLWVSAALVVLTCSATAGAAVVIGLVVLAYIQVEAYVLAPRLTARAVSTPPVVVLVAGAAGAALAGLPGAVAAVPVAAVIRIVFHHVRMGAEVQVREEPPGGPFGASLRAEFWSEVAVTAGLALGDGPPASDLVDLVAPDGSFVVAVRGDEALGCVGVRSVPGGAVEVKRLFVSSRARGLGLGRRLLTWCEDWGRSRGATRIVLDTHGSLTPARALYLSAGFEEVDRYNDNPHAQHWYAKDLR